MQYRDTLPGSVTVNVSKSSTGIDPDSRSNAVVSAAAVGAMMIPFKTIVRGAYHARDAQPPCAYVRCVT
jgi:hypothetical protein